MFNPLHQPAFVAGREPRRSSTRTIWCWPCASATTAAAYPIRQMAYHHLVNDRIGRTPAVVTY